MAIQFGQAKRERIWAKILLAGPSGAGKTYSALRLATGIAKKMGGKIAAIDTENGRIRYYADEFDFDDMRLTSPYEPEKYIEAIETAVDAGYSVLIIDSITHEWDYCLDIHNKMPGNSYTNWAKITPRHDAFMEKILQSDIHIVSTVRGKDEYVMEEKNGKQVPKKVGLGYKQRDNTEYNYSVTFNIDQDTHIADATKDNTHIFEGKYEKLTEKHGEKIYEWANSSKIEPEKHKTTEPTESVSDIIKQIKSTVASATENGVTKETIIETTKSICIIDGKTTANYNKITDIKMAKDLLDAISNLKG